MNEILDELNTLLSAAFTTTFKTYYKHKIGVAAKDNLPLCSVYGIETRQFRSGTLRDRAEFDVAVEIMVNLRDYFDPEGGSSGKIETMEALTNLVEDRETDGDAKAATVFGIVNSDLTVNGRVLYTDGLRARYDQYLDSRDTIIGKVTVTFTAHDRPNRV